MSNYYQHFKADDLPSGQVARVYAMNIDPNNFTIQNLGSDSVYTSTRSGINGTFFGSYLYGIAVQKFSGTTDSVRPSSSWQYAGLANGNASVLRNRSTMYETTSGTIGVTQTTWADDITGDIDDLRWGIGGLGLYLNNTTLTKSQYDDLLDGSSTSIRFRYNSSNNNEEVFRHRVSTAAQLSIGQFNTNSTDIVLNLQNNPDYGTLGDLS